MRSSVTWRLWLSVACGMKSERLTMAFKAVCGRAARSLCDLGRFFPPATQTSAALGGSWISHQEQHNCPAPSSLQCLLTWAVARCFSLTYDPRPFMGAVSLLGFSSLPARSATRLTRGNGTAVPRRPEVRSVFHSLIGEHASMSVG